MSSGCCFVSVNYNGRLHVKTVNKSSLCIALGSDMNLLLNEQLASASIKTVYKITRIIFRKSGVTSLKRFNVGTFYKSSK